jgi:formate dehydrogenase subunit delta
VDSGIQHLAKMANQIGSFFEAQSLADPPAAAKAIASHLKLFWAPSMRERLIGALDSGHAQELDPLVATALRTHRQTLLTAAAATNAEKDESFPEGGGDAG